MILFLMIGFILLTNIFVKYISNKKTLESEHLINVIMTFIIANILFFYVKNRSLLNSSIVVSLAITFANLFFTNYALKRSYYLSSTFKSFLFLINSSIYLIVLPVILSYLEFQTRNFYIEGIKFLNYEILLIQYPFDAHFYLKICSLISSFFILILTYNKFNFTSCKKWLLALVLLNSFDSYFIAMNYQYYKSIIHIILALYTLIFLVPTFMCFLNLFGFNSSFFNALWLLFSLYKSTEYEKQSVSMIVNMINTLKSPAKEVLLILCITSRQKALIRIIKSKINLETNNTI